MKIALAHRTPATLAFVTVDPKKSALEEVIRVHLDNANAVHLMNVHLQIRVILEHAHVINYKFPKHYDSPYSN